jgi:hypothetical protein
MVIERGDDLCHPMLIFIVPTGPDFFVDSK